MYVNCPIKFNDFREILPLLKVDFSEYVIETRHLYFFFPVSQKFKIF
jgi:hypothetical protein